jgi:hypothetical protein
MGKFIFAVDQGLFIPAQESSEDQKAVISAELQTTVFSIFRVIARSLIEI